MEVKLYIQGPSESKCVDCSWLVFGGSNEKETEAIK